MTTADPSPTYAGRALELMSTFEGEAVVSGDRRLSYDELCRRVIAMAAVLYDHGIRPGDTVGVLAYNPPESLFLELALHLSGCRSAWVAPAAPPRFKHDFVRQAELAAFVYDATTLGEIGAELADVAAPRPVFCFGPGGRGPDLAQAVAVDRELPFDPAAVTTAPGALFQTSGTTGTPKLVHHGPAFFESLLATGRAIRAAGGPPLRHLITAGTWHVSSQTGAFMTLFSGGTLFLQEGLEDEVWLATVEAERISSGMMSPQQLYRLLDCPALPTTDLSSMQALTISGSPAAPAKMLAAIDVFGPAIRLVYGMSECTMITAQPNLTYDPDHPERLGSCGLPFPETEIEIRDTDGVVLPAGVDGDVWVRSALAMTGYYGAPDLTARALRDGWLRTEDVGHLDADGYLYLVDRVRDIIITGYGATNVYCRPVEDALMSYPGVRAAAVIGIPDPAFGERVMAYVVSSVAPAPDPEKLRAHVADQLNAFWAPSVIEFVPELPLSPSGKVDKKELRQRRHDLDHDRRTATP